MNTGTINIKTISHEGGRKMHMYAQYFVVHQYSISHDIWPLTATVVGSFHNNDAKWYFTSDASEYWLTRLSEFTSNPQRIIDLESFIHSTSEEGVKFLKDLELENMSPQELSESLRKYFYYFETLVRVASTVRIIDRAVVFKIRNSNYPNPDETLRTISINERPGFAFQEERDLALTAKKLKDENIDLNSKEAEKLILDLFNKYAWITAGYYNEKAKTLEDYKGKIASLITADPEKILKEHDEKLKHDVETRQAFVANLNSEDKAMADIASISTYLKDYYKFCANKLIYHAEPLFAEVAKRLNISSAEAKDLYPEDVFSYIESGKIDKDKNNSILAENVLYVENNKFHALFGDEAKAFSKEYLETDHADKKEFKGRVASMGDVRGKAIVVQGPSEFHKMKDGHILVVVNTSPDYVPIMHLAKGIVAEEGGLTAHVSVVSREFRIPAIVGIRGICKVIKDGDEVELNTKTGIVKILS